MAELYGLTEEEYRLHQEYTGGRGRTEAHRKAHSAYNTAWKAWHKQRDTVIGNKLRDRSKEYMHNRAITGPGYRALWLTNTKHRAKRKGLPFDLTLDDIFFPAVCPVLSIPLRMSNRGFSDNSPSLDRIIPEKGYVKGNVVVMSYRANRIKCHASLEELEAIVAFMKRQLG